MIKARKRRGTRLFYDGRRTKPDGPRLMICVAGLLKEELPFAEKVLGGREPSFEGTLGRICGCRMAGGPRWRKLASDWGGKGLQASRAPLVKPDAVLGWRRKLVAKKFYGSKHRRLPGRPDNSRIDNLVSRIGTQKLRLGLRSDFGQPGLPGIRPGCGSTARRHGIDPVTEKSKTTTWIGSHSPA
jgi:putative transposase